jgi:hypothetical protein
MPMVRHQFRNITVSGGVAHTDTGPPINGAILQMRWWHPADTGQVASIQLSALPDTADTGIGWLIYSSVAANLGTQFTKTPRQPTHDLAGDMDGDTGTPTAPSPWVFAGDRLKLKVTPSDTGVVLSGGRLYIWIFE